MKKDDKKSEKISFWDKLANNSLFIVITGICSILGLIISLFGDNFVFKIISFIIIGVTIVAFIIIAVCRYLSFRNLKRIASKTFEEKEISIFETIEEQNRLYKQCFDNIKNGMVISYDNLDYLLKPLIDCMVDLSKNIINDKTSICIKIIETDSLMNEDINSWKIRTIARSRSTKFSRKQKDNQSILISQNSDFKTIIDGENPNYSDCFLVPNLEELIDIWKESGHEYHNSTFNFLECYKSTMVFPIRTEVERVSPFIREHISLPNSSSIKYHVIGFLCWDSKRIFSEDDSSFSKLAELLNSFSEMLYPLLEEYIVHQLQGAIKINTAKSVIEV